MYMYYISFFILTSIFLIITQETKLLMVYCQVTVSELPLKVRTSNDVRQSQLRNSLQHFCDLPYESDLPRPLCANLLRL